MPPACRSHAQSLARSIACAYTCILSPLCVCASSLLITLTCALRWWVSFHCILSSQGRQVIPALGLAWTEQVNTRLLLQRHDRAAMAPSHNHASAAAGAAAEDASNVSRSISVTLASHLPASSCSFYVDAAGVHGVE